MFEHLRVANVLIVSISILTALAGIILGVTLSNADTNRQYAKCEQYAAQNHMYANCPAHLISNQPINWPTGGNN